MKKLITLKLATWFEIKQKDAFHSASCNAHYFYEVTKETEKAIQITILKDGEKTWAKMMSPWTMWIPKSAIINISEVVA